MSEPNQEVCLHTKAEEGFVDWRRKQPNRADSSADDAHHKGYDHQHPVTMKGSLLILFDDFHCFEPLRELRHERVAIIKVSRLSKEKVLYCFIFLHNFLSSIFNSQFLSQFVPASRELLLHGILRGLSNRCYLLDAVAVEVEQGDGGAFLGRKRAKGEVEV